MAMPLAPWISVHPGDYLAASQAGANVGLAIAKLRQEQQEQRLRIRATSEELAADRQASYDRLREQLNAQRELKMADLAAERERDSARILDSNAGRDLQIQGLDFRRSQEEFDQDQARRKLLLSADSNEQEGRLMRGVAEDRSPAGILKATSSNPLAKSALPLANHALTLEAQTKTQKLKQDLADELDAARNEVQKAYEDAGGGKAGFEAAQKVPGWTKLSSGQQAQIRLSQPSGGSYLDRLLASEAGTPPLGGNPLPIPRNKAELEKGQAYQTARGVATWNGEKFVQ